MPADTELIRWMISAGIVCFVVFLPALRERPVRYRILYCLALLCIMVTMTLFIEWLISAGYKTELEEATNAAFWLGPTLLFYRMGIKERRFGKALAAAGHSPVPGWETYDNTERNEEEAVRYAQGRRITSSAAFAVAGIWFIGGLLLYVA